MVIFIVLKQLASYTEFPEICCSCHHVWKVFFSILILKFLYTF